MPFTNKKMKKTLLAIFLTLFAAVGTRAQNNAYDIDDSCYFYLNRCEQYISKPQFQENADMLYKMAVERKDKKALTIYYVEILKNASRAIPSGVTTTPSQDEVILKMFEDLKRIAKENGFYQYYYYAYEVTKNYFYNHNQRMRSVELVDEMLHTAQSRKDEYGMWQGYRFMISAYVAENDYISAKDYILKALDIYNTSKDSVIRRQSPTRLYCDLADTYTIGNDSLRINVEKAYATSKLHMDTLRCEYYMAKLSAFERDQEAYKKHKEYCLADPGLTTISKSAVQLFQTLDAIIDGTFDASKITPNDFSSVREFKFVANIAEAFGYKDEAFNLEKVLVRRQEQLLSAKANSRAAEMDARIGNQLLHAELDSKAEQVQRNSRTIVILLFIILLAVITFLAMHQMSLVRHNKQLAEANEKVTLANAAKTRFVQNMSHEVRTPLNAIVGFSQLLSLPDGTFPEEEKEQFAGHIINNSKMLTMLLDDILNASAMDSGEYRITYEPSELHFICNAAISSTEHRLQPGVTMSYEPESPEPFNFTTDPRRVQQILINLLTNACKHTQKGSIVLRSSLTKEPGYVTLSVTDTGTGVPADQAEAIFNRFTKLNEFVQGTGLGLSICRDIASRMDAKVYLDTTWQGPGARFIFSVPVTPKTENKNEKTA